MTIPDPIKLFMEQHQEGLAQLEIMGRAARVLKEKGFSPEVALAIIRAKDFIATEVKLHNQMEEEALFPLLEQVVGPGGPVAVMLMEHRQLWEGLDALTLQLADLRDSPEKQNLILAVADSADFVINLLTNHIAKEDRVLYPMAQQVLRREAMQEVARRMESMLAPSLKA